MHLPELAYLTRYNLLLKIRLIDFDQVSLSSLNRHAVATLADVGNPKVHVMQRRLAAIAPVTAARRLAKIFSFISYQAFISPQIGRATNMTISTANSTTPRSLKNM